MSGNFKRIIYAVGTGVGVFLIATLFIRILPWLLGAGLISYIIMKISRFIRSRKKQKHEDNFNKSYNNKDIYESPNDDYSNGEIIDVDYEEIDNQKD